MFGFVETHRIPGTEVTVEVPGRRVSSNLRLVVNSADALVGMVVPHGNTVRFAIRNDYDVTVAFAVMLLGSDGTTTNIFANGSNDPDALLTTEMVEVLPGGLTAVADSSVHPGQLDLRANDQGSRVVVGDGDFAYIVIYQRFQVLGNARDHRPNYPDDIVYGQAQRIATISLISTGRHGELEQQIAALRPSTKG